MRRLIVSMNITQDGFCAGTQGELDWHFTYWSKEMGDALCEQLAMADTVLLGRITYSVMAEYWPLKLIDPACRGEDVAFWYMMDAYTKVVVSRTVTRMLWNNTTLLKGHLRAAIIRLKTNHGKNIIVYGSCQLVKALIAAGLVDIYHLWVHPVSIGNGTPFLQDLRNTASMVLLRSETFSSGVVLLEYQHMPY